jgi:hypothetical protein
MDNWKRERSWYARSTQAVYDGEEVTIAGFYYFAI